MRAWLVRFVAENADRGLTTAIRVDQGCSRYGIRSFDEPFRHWSVPLLVKCRITCLGVTLRELETFCTILFYDFIGSAAHQTVFSVACNSDSEILLALQTAETVTVVRTRRDRLDADKFPMFSVGWTWHGLSRFGSLLV